MLLQMGEPDSSRRNGESVHVVSDPRQARLLTDGRSKTFLNPFLAQERTISQAAREVGVGLGTMYYRVTTFLETGLLRVTREEKRAGRAIRHYRAVADAFFVPFEVTPYSDLEERVLTQLEPVWRQIARSYARVLQEHERAGQYIFRGETGTVWTGPAASRSSEASPVIPNAGLHDVTLNLTQAQATNLLRILSDLSERYQRIGGEGGGRPYILQAALVPLVDAADT